MRICSICRSGAVPDDVVFTLNAGGCICLRCYSRETGAARPLPADLRSALEEILSYSVAPLAPRPPRVVTAMHDLDDVCFPRGWRPWWQTLPGGA